MIQIEVNQEELKELYLQKIDERLKEIEEETFFFDSKGLLKAVKMSWNSANTHLLSDPNFPAIRLGNKWLFPKKEVMEYMQKFYEEVRDSGGDIHKYVRR